MAKENSEVNNRAITVAKVRTHGARVVWGVCLAFALILAVAAFSYALELREQNPLVGLFRDLADAVDLGIFDLDNPIKAFDDDDATVKQTKEALTNYGLGAIFYIVIGRLAERIVRP